MDSDAVALFHELVDRPPSERDAYYRQRQVPAAVRAEVESLLRFDGTSGPSLSEYVAAAAEDTLLESAAVPPGSRFGSYRLLRRLGGGGMGTVYEAEQESPRRIVALKVISAGLAGPDLVRRFKQESLALGRLQHSGIAQIYEAGTADTPFGPQPYFAMELVRGEPLLQYADSHHLDTRQRLELITRICEGVHHAHQRGIVHRDLKPGNILVEETGQPRILDFGVARVTDSDMPPAGHTDAGQLVGTLAYMSPEQVLADPLEVDTRSDVYALGVILYELLAKRLPYNTTGKLHEVVQAIREQDPVRLGSINRACRGDVEIIVAKALEKEKARRYGSATALADDIQRYLKNQPIVARRSSAVYQLQKFTKRNKAVVAGVTAVFGALVAGVFVSARQASRALRAERVAAQEAAMSKAINDFLQNDLLAQASSFTQAKPGTRPDPDLKVRTALDRAAASVADKFQGQPLIEASIRNTIGLTYRDLGLYPEAQHQLEQAVELQQRVLGRVHHDTLSTVSRLAALHVTQGRYLEAEPLAVNVLEVRRRVLGEDHPDTLASMFVLADMYRMQRKNAQAEPILVRILEAHRRLKGEAHRETLDSQDVLAVVYRLQGKYAPAEQVLRQVLAARRRSQGDEHPDTLSTLNSLVVLHDTMGRYPQAQALASELLEAERRVLGEEHPNTRNAMYQLAILHLREGRFGEAELLCKKALTLGRYMPGDDSAPVLTMMNTLGVMYVEAGNDAEAESTLQHVLAVRRRVLGEENPDTLNTLSALSQLYRSRGDYASAETLLTSVQRVRLRILGATHPSTLSAGHDLGVVYLAQDAHAQAEAAFVQALAGRRQVLGDDHPDTLASLIGLVESYGRQGEYLRAEPMAVEALERYEKARPENWRRYKAQNLLGDILAGQSRFDEGEPLLLAGYKGLTEREPTIPASDRAAVRQAADRVFELYRRRGQPEKAAAWRTRTESGDRTAPPG